MLKVLVPIDGSSASERAVRHVIDLIRKTGERMEVHLVNVQEGADAPELRRFMKESEIKRAQLGHGADQLQPAKRLLDRSGTEYEEHVLIGDPAEKIAQFAKRGSFDTIVMGTNGRGTLGSLLMGSVATKVVQHATVPVTLVK
jgi:nucleotide-binding universal stress UspA family protein